MAPPFVRSWGGWNPPISRHWLGGHKTVVGFAAGLAGAPPPPPAPAGPPPGRARGAGEPRGGCGAGGPGGG